ncbi:hypothetical protein B0O80DRAFT_423686 [Mortierella sp. GBAus27b]|nr:hypothetical protein B0O80DRAFT_423686 [Mortierella sp. GBAus27b]
MDQQPDLADLFLDAVDQKTWTDTQLYVPICHPVPFREIASLAAAAFAIGSPWIAFVFTRPMANRSIHVPQGLADIHRHDMQRIVRWIWKQGRTKKGASRYLPACYE